MSSSRDEAAGENDSVTLRKTRIRGAIFVNEHLSFRVSLVLVPQELASVDPWRRGGGEVNRQAASG
ncbi:hypothetical protein E2C01_012217 [Portunus trituberculatus]|uniref:Uncharacterized protein n=1 Tax=Portunus trituberculatus TaxID=210409 RepID=A0A5B7DE10_PORTR|nr:hypothetical protein [Portunus trituberculatus]